MSELMLRFVSLLCHSEGTTFSLLLWVHPWRLSEPCRQQMSGISNLPSAFSGIAETQAPLSCSRGRVLPCVSAAKCGASGRPGLLSRDVCSPAVVLLISVFRSDYRFASPSLIKVSNSTRPGSDLSRIQPETS